MRINIVSFLYFGFHFVQKKDASARKLEGEGHAGSGYIFFLEELAISYLVNAINCESGKVLSIRVFSRVYIYLQVSIIGQT